MASAIRVVSQQYSPALNLLIVNDDRWTKEACKAVAEKLGYTVSTADSAVPALLHLSSHPADVVLVDAAASEAEAVQLVGRIRKLHPNSEIAVVGASAQDLSSSLKSVDFECLRKPFQTEEVTTLLQRIASRLRARHDGMSTVAFNPGAGVSSALIGESPEMQKLLRIASRAGPSRNPVLIVGESGTGKEKLARSIHAAGAAQEATFISVDCASPDTAMIEAGLFAKEQTSDSTIFLDEVAALPLELQGKLVRALQDRMVRLPGRTAPAPFDARLIAATQHDLEPAGRPAPDHAGWQQSGARRKALAQCARVGEPCGPGARAPAFPATRAAGQPPHRERWCCRWSALSQIARLQSSPYRGTHNPRK